MQLVVLYYQQIDVDAAVGQQCDAVNHDGKQRDAAAVGKQLDADLRAAEYSLMFMWLAASCSCLQAAGC